MADVRKRVGGEVFLFEIMNGYGWGRVFEVNIDGGYWRSAIGVKVRIVFRKLLELRKQDSIGFLDNDMDD